MHLADLFDSIYIINLAHRNDRRQDMSADLRRIGVDPSGPKVTWFPALDPKSAAGFHNPGVRGCFLSHVAVLNMARNRGENRVLILEDDCTFSPDFQERESEVAGWLDSAAWGIAYLGHVEQIGGPPRLVTWESATRVRLLHCYSVAGEVLSRLAGYLEAITLRSRGAAEGGPMFSDGGFDWFRRQNPDVTTVLVNPSLASQRVSRSDLSPRWFDKVPVLRNVAHGLRGLRS